MKLPISNRLLVCAGFVAPGERVADIGCDHGYLGIYLLLNNRASSIIAADINPGPLQAAVINSEKYGVRDKIHFYLSDGVQNIPKDFDTMVFAGVGADTMISVLEAAPWLKSSKYRLILQCQSKTPLLRQYLSEHDWRIQEESVLQDGKFLYTVMEVTYQPGYSLTPGECYFPPALLENPSIHLPAYYRWVVGGLQVSTAHRYDAFQAAALKELTALVQQPELKFLKEVTP